MQELAKRIANKKDEGSKQDDLQQQARRIMLVSSLHAQMLCTMTIGACAAGLSEELLVVVMKVSRVFVGFCLFGEAL